jgi:hypothetical protein
MFCIRIGNKKYFHEAIKIKNDLCSYIIVKVHDIDALEVVQALKVFRSPVWLLLHKFSLPHYRYIRKMRRGDRLPLTQLMNCISGELVHRVVDRGFEAWLGQTKGYKIVIFCFTIATSHFTNITVVWRG